MFQAFVQNASKFILAKFLMTFGGCMVLFGILILVHPQILVILVAGFFLFLGIIILGYGIALHTKKPTQSKSGQYWEIK